ncbi:MAG: iron-sulfur cluster carrier protein ApbC [Candidatus Thioglobus sp.]|nr:iron-sulfur cluster carrier protein ApbC [Candidatus Thioglobus sp.]
MSTITEDKIQTILSSIIDENTGKDLVSSDNLKNISIDDEIVNVELLLKYPAANFHEDLKGVVEQALSKEGVNYSNISINSKIPTYETQGVDALPGVKNIIAVASGKGGVGKSTTAVNLALALKSEGANVAILDADIYGPSQPRMLGAKDLRPQEAEGGNMKPVMAHGIQSMSIGFLVDEASPMVWRGPMVTQALEQLLKNTEWEDVDYMIIDMPPGTGDTQLTLSQKIPVSGAVIVTTPQDIALIDAQKGLAMFEKVNIPILGIVENMSIHICSNCNHAEEIFGHGGGKHMANNSKTNFLGALPLQLDIRTDVDEGTPSVVNDPDSQVTGMYQEIARKVAGALSLKNESVGAFPKITIE